MIAEQTPNLSFLRADPVENDELPGLRPESSEASAVPAPDGLDAGHCDNPQESIAFSDSHNQVQSFDQAQGLEGTIFMSEKRAQITCINKSHRYNPWERITHVGGINGGGGNGEHWKLTQPQAISMIENEGWSFWVSVRGKGVWVIVSQSRFGNKYLKTEADEGEDNNLLNLPECP